MKFLVSFILLFSFNAVACWKMQATISINDDVVKINQKVDHDKTYSFPVGKHIFHVKIPSKFEIPANIKDKKDVHTIEIGVQEKKGITLSEITEGKIIVQTGKEATMTKQDNKSGEITTYIMKITEI
jgi:hypothetical protein